MASEEKIIEFIKKGICKFSKLYHANVLNVQICLRLDKDKKVVFITCLNNEPKHTVKLKDLIGDNLYNFLRKKKIEELLEKLAHKHGIACNEINLMTGLRDNDVVYLCVRKDQSVILEITDPGELMEK